MQDHELSRNDSDRWFRRAIDSEQTLTGPSSRQSRACRSAWLSDLLSGSDADEDFETGPAVRSMTEISSWLGYVGAFTFLLAIIYLALGASVISISGIDAVPRGSAARPVQANGVVTGSNQHVAGLIEHNPISTSLSEQMTALKHSTSAAVPPDPARRIKAGSGEAFRDRLVTGAACLQCPEIVVVPAGAFLLGGSANEASSEDWQRALETPQVRVTIAKTFAVGRHAVTFDEWDACVSDGGCASTPSDNGWGKGNRPVINVSWLDANSYVVWLSHKTGQSYRLLSEAEREYVARAGTTSAFTFGAAPSPKRANYSWDRTLPVNQLPPNAWGLYQMHGNVSDWTADCWNANHRGHPGDASARLTGNCSRRVVKGGSWFNGPSLIRSAARSGLSSEAQYKTVGFRVARDIMDGPSD